MKLWMSSFFSTLRLETERPRVKRIIVIQNNGIAHIPRDYPVALNQLLQAIIVWNPKHMFFSFWLWFAARGYLMFADETVRMRPSVSARSCQLLKTNRRWVFVSPDPCFFSITRFTVWALITRA